MRAAFFLRFLAAPGVTSRVPLAVSGVSSPLSRKRVPMQGICNKEVCDPNIAAGSDHYTCLHWFELEMYRPGHKSFYLFFPLPDFGATVVFFRLRNEHALYPNVARRRRVRETIGRLCGDRESLEHHDFRLLFFLSESALSAGGVT